MARAQKLRPSADLARAYSLQQAAAPAHGDDLAPSVPSTHPVLQPLAVPCRTFITSNPQDCPESSASRPLPSREIEKTSSSVKNCLKQELNRRCCSFSLKLGPPIKPFPCGFACNNIGLKLSTEEPGLELLFTESHSHLLDHFPSYFSLPKRKIGTSSIQKTCSGKPLIEGGQITLKLCLEEEAQNSVHGDSIGNCTERSGYRKGTRFGYHLGIGPHPFRAAPQAGFKQ